MALETLTWNEFPPPIKNYNTREELEKTKMIQETTEVGFVESTKNMWEFINDVKNEGFWMALYDKPFTQVTSEFMVDCLKAIGIFITGNGDLFFLFPALGVTVATFMVGRNKWTKWILPLIFAYFASRAFFRMLLTLS